MRRRWAASLLALAPMVGALALVSADTRAAAADRADAGIADMAGLDARLLEEVGAAAPTEKVRAAEPAIALPHVVEEALTAWEEEAEAGIQDEPAAQTIGGGEASYYGRELAGNRTASGEIFDPSKLTAAHRTLPLGSRVRVIHRRSGRSVVVRINDRGPFHGNRVIDLSEAAAREIGMVRAGRAQVGLELLGD